MQVWELLQNNLFFIKLEQPPTLRRPISWVYNTKQDFFPPAFCLFFFSQQTVLFWYVFHPFHQKNLWAFIWKKKKHWKNWREKERLYIWKAIKNHSECAVVIAFLEKQTRQAVWNVKESCVRAGRAAGAEGDGLMAGVLGVQRGAVHFPLLLPLTSAWPQQGQRENDFTER